ncbi:MAG: hypothetical protein K8R06_11140 [Methanosarcinales archaeon]|nr:hypothetical protein [Methanosarcinales archaeon]
MTHGLHMQDQFLIPFFRECFGYNEVKHNTVTSSASLFHFSGVWGAISSTLTDQATMQAEKVLQFCIEPRSRNEIQSFLDLKNRDYFRKEILNPLIKEGKLALTIPDKPKSPKQRYITRNEHKGNE